MHGGTKLKNREKTGFKAIFDMIQSPNSRLELLTVASLKGFIFTLNVDQDYSEYLKLNKGRFGDSTTKFILKFAVIAPQNNTVIPNYKTIQKNSESASSFFEEATMQQTIWTKSIYGGKEEICPPVGNFSLFDNPNASELLSFLKDRSSVSTNSKDIFEYLLNIISTTSSYGLGVIMMPLIENSITLGDAINNSSLTSEQKEQVYTKSLAQVTRLLIDIGVIHFDLHSNNLLIYIDSNNVIHSVIIDFGRASNIMSGQSDEYLTNQTKDLIKSQIKGKDGWYDKLFKITDRNEKELFIKDIIENIAYHDRDYYQFTDGGYQSDWMEDALTNPQIVGDAFDELYQSIAITDTPRISARTIAKFQQSGQVALFNDDIDISHFYVPFNRPTPLCDADMENLGMCTIMGGGSKSRSKSKIKKNKNSSRKYKCSGFRKIKKRTKHKKRTHRRRTKKCTTHKR